MVLKTEDSGRTWSDLTFSVKDKNLLLYGMCFINDSVGYLTGAELYERNMVPKLYMTNDGGISWSEGLKDIPHMILNLEKEGPDLLAMGNGFIMRIDTRMNTWEYVFKDTSGVVGQIRGLQFADDTIGLGISFNGKVLMTSDGGDSFTIKTITTNRLRSLVYLGEEKWLAAGDNNKNDGAVLYLSSNHGEHWEKDNDFPDIHRIFLTGKDIWIVGKNGFIAKKKRH